MNFEGNKVVLPWVGDAKEAVVVLYTHLGAVDVQLKRPADVNVTLEYEMPPDQWVLADVLTNRYRTLDMHNKRLGGILGDGLVKEGCTAPGGEFAADCKTLTVETKKPDELRNAKIEYVGGPGDKAFSEVLQEARIFDEDTKADARFRAWSHPMVWELTAEVWRLNTDVDPIRRVVTCNQARCSLSVPKASSKRKLHFGLAGGDIVTVSLGDSNEAKGIVCIDKNENIDPAEYVYRFP